VTAVSRGATPERISQHGEIGTGPVDLAELAERAVGGDERARDLLLAQVRVIVHRYCRARLGRLPAGQHAADDVAQEVCLAVLKALPTYIDQGKPFLAFVYGIAGHKVVDAHRHAGRDRSEPTDEVPEGIDDRGGPEQHALELSASAEMRDLLAQLPEKQREILVLRVVVGLSAEETALAVGSTPGAVRVAQHRAVAKLRGVLEPPDGGRRDGDGDPTELFSTRAAAGSPRGRQRRA
jgi:RNA polymerase sigma-70 factor, ECF subfamily